MPFYPTPYPQIAAPDYAEQGDIEGNVQIGVSLKPTSSPHRVKPIQWVLKDEWAQNPTNLLRESSRKEAGADLFRIIFFSKTRYYYFNYIIFIFVVHNRPS